MSYSDISVSIITLNEEKFIEKSIESVKNLTDDIVVVDSGSKDQTVEIAQKLGAKVYKRDFDNFANQKNFASEKAKNAWILSLDADEIVTKELGDEIAEAVTKGINDAYSIPRENIIFGKKIKYTRWQPELDRHVWLWKKNKGHWVGRVHEEVEVYGSIGKIKNPKIHYQYNTVNEFFEMMDKYSELEAAESFKKYKTKKWKYILLSIFNPIYNFFVRYFYRLGFLDGWRGFVLSYLMAIYEINVSVKIYERLYAENN